MSTSTSSVDTTRRRAEHAWQKFILALDHRLQRQHHIFEFTDDPACVFRIQLGLSDQQLVLFDGTRVRRGDRILNLHLWNEHIPPVPKTGASIRWGREMANGMKLSLRALARYLVTRRDLDDVCVIRGDATWATASQAEQFVRFCHHLGFEVIVSGSPVSIRERIRRFGDNILVSLLVLAHNSTALRRDTLWRAHTPIFLSRSVLEHRYGVGGR